MAHENFSKHIGYASELLLSADVKQGFIPHRRTMTYASRLRTFLKLVSEPRARSINGNERGIFVTPIDRLKTLYLVRWTLFDDDKRLLLAVNFDHPIGPYLRQIVDEGGPLLDTILCHTTDYAQSSTDLGYKAFMAFAERHQINVDLFTGTYPQLTSDDYNYLMGMERLQRDTPDPSVADLAIAGHRLLSPGQQAYEMLKDVPGNTNRGLYQQQALRLLRAVHYASRFFPEPDPHHPGAGPDPESKDHIFYKDFARLLVEQVDFDQIPPGDKAPFLQALGWLQSGPSNLSLPERGPQTTFADPSNVQGGIVKRYKAGTDAQPEPMNLGAMLLLRFRDSAAGAAFLNGIKDRVSTAADGRANAPRVNLALTYRGLKTLNVPEDERHAFPSDFREGMEARAGMLADVGQNSPLLWDPRRHDADGNDAGPLDLESVDAILQVQMHYAGDMDETVHGWTGAHPLRATADALLTDGTEVLAAERMVRYLNAERKMVGHFGFIDGISNPQIVEDTAHHDYAPLGGFILGYDDDQSMPLPDLQRDGTYLVVRKMSQDVARFNGTLDQTVREKMMGRTLDGVPLVAPTVTDNSFDYKNDPDGRLCPLSAHIRRANPRLPAGKDPVTGEIKHHDTPRIMRRGYSYGPKLEEGTNDDAERGMMFLCYNASIGEQFEVIQRWIGGGNITGIYSGHNDPMLGPAPAHGDRIFRYLSDDGRTVIRKNLGRQGYSRVKWGLYAFVPSIEAIGRIAAWGQDPATTRAAEDGDLARKGAAVIAGLRTLDDWKRVLEDGDLRNSEKGDAVMAHIDQVHGGVYRVDYEAGPDGQAAGHFVIVSHPERVMEVFRDTESFSNRAYWRRMKDSMGSVYLGMDPVPQPLSKITNDDEDRIFEQTTEGAYDRTSQDVNPHLGAYTQEADRRRLFHGYLPEVKRGIDALPDEYDPEITNGRRILIDMEELIGSVIGTHGLRWLGLPGTWLQDVGEDPAQIDETITLFPHLVGQAGAPMPAPRGTPKTPDDFQEMAAYFFGPWPKPDYKVRGEVTGQNLRDRVTRWLDRRGGDLLPKASLIGKLQRITKDGARVYTNKEMTELALNSAVGLNAPTCASFAGIAYDWLREGTFWRIQQDFVDAVKRGQDAFDAAQAVMHDPMIASMARFGGPKHLHRTCAKDGVRIGDVDVAAGAQVVMALGPAAQNCPMAEVALRKEILFGGLYDGKVRTQTLAPVHSCPGRGIAMTLMMIAMAAVMTSGQIVRNSSLTVYVRPGRVGRGLRIGQLPHPAVAQGSGPS